MIYLISINYQWLLSLHQAFCESYTCIGKGFEKLENIGASGIDQGIFKWRMSGNHAADMGKDAVLISAPDKKG